MAISGVFLLGGGGWCVVGWGGGSHERPRFQSTAQEVFARGQLDVVVCGTGMTAAMIQVFIQPQTEVSTEKKKKGKVVKSTSLASHDSGCRHVEWPEIVNSLLKQKNKSSCILKASLG